MQNRSIFLENWSYRKRYGKFEIKVCKDKKDKEKTYLIKYNYILTTYALLICFTGYEIYI